MTGDSQDYQDLIEKALVSVNIGSGNSCNDTCTPMPKGWIRKN
jgi:hypothetical protein